MFQDSTEAGFELNQLVKSLLQHGGKAAERGKSTWQDTTCQDSDDVRNLALLGCEAHLRRRSVWPVGAVSKTMQLNSITWTYLSHQVWSQLKPSPVNKKAFIGSLHKLRETHRLVDAGDALNQVLHHGRCSIAGEGEGGGWGGHAPGVSVRCLSRESRGFAASLAAAVAVACMLGSVHLPRSGMASSSSIVGSISCERIQINLRLKPLHKTGAIGNSPLHTGSKSLPPGWDPC